jgi:hypothetical protein
LFPLAEPFREWLAQRLELAMALLTDPFDQRQARVAVLDALNQGVVALGVEGHEHRSRQHAQILA